MDDVSRSSGTDCLLVMHAVTKLEVSILGVAEIEACHRILPRLTPLAASGLVAIMILAVPFHIQRGEINLIGIPIALGVLAAFVAWGGRFRGVPIDARG